MPFKETLHGDSVADDAVAVLLQLRLRATALWRHAVWIRIATLQNTWMVYEYQLPNLNRTWAIHKHNPHPLERMGRVIIEHNFHPGRGPELLNDLYIDGLVQERRNSSKLAMELVLSCTNPSMYRCRKTSYIYISYSREISEDMYHFMCILTYYRSKEYHMRLFQWSHYLI